MQKGSPSLTSIISAFGRAYHSRFDQPKIFDDYLAERLISEDEYEEIKANMIQGIGFFNEELAQKWKGHSEQILKWITQVQLSPTPLARAAYCEGVLLNEVRLGAKQYVILGAGLDTFCFRHPELQDTLDIFEVDSPMTQEFKKKKLEQAGFEIPSHLHFVPMDFSKAFSWQPLIEAGFTGKKTFFSLLGVSYYLTKDELSSLLAHLFALVPTGSSIVFDYADETLFEAKGVSNRVENMVKMAAASGEPMKSCYSYSEMERLLEQCGLLIYETLTPEKINERYFSNRQDHLSAFETIHYVHAVKK
ncbi:class I SAM-dependent methyltransferase [Bacillus sp. FSL W7-1321]